MFEHLDVCQRLVLYLLVKLVELRLEGLMKENYPRYKYYVLEGISSTSYNHGS